MDLNIYVIWKCFLFNCFIAKYFIIPEMWNRVTEITEPYIKKFTLVTLWDHESVNINYPRQFDQSRNRSYA